MNTRPADPGPEREGLSSRDLPHVLLAAVEAAPVAVTIAQLSASGARLVFVNDRAAALFGRSRDELLEGDAFDCLPPEEATRMRRRVAARMQGESVSATFETRIVHGAGKVLPVLVTVCELRRDGQVLVVSFFVDASERESTRRALEASEARFHKLIESAPEAIVVSRDAVVLFANPAASRLLELDTPSQLVGQPLSVFLPPAEVARARDRMREVLGGSAAAPTVYSAHARGGKPLKAEVTSMPVEWDGAPALLAIVRDVTERERLREELTRADRMVALGTLAAGVAHELNNPLAYVTLGLEVLERMLAEPILDQSGRARALATLHELRGGVERASLIVRDLQTFARDQPEATSSPVSELEAVVASAARLTAHEVGERARLVIRLGPTPPVSAPPLRLEQVLVNLLLNAAHAFERFDRANSITIDSSVLDDDRVQLRVQDNGQGIPVELQSRVFDPFFTTKPVGAGTGLGLSICHSIITRIGGKISFDSREQIGTTFTLTLPSAAQPIAAEPPSVPVKAARARILVVDDEIAVCRAMKRLLSGAHDVEFVTSGEEALERLQRDPGVDVILCDLAMPNMTGMDVFEALVRDGRGLERRMVLMSGAILDGQLGRFVKRVPNTFLPKPFEARALELAIERLGRRSDPGGA